MDVCVSVFVFVFDLGVVSWQLYDPQLLASWTEHDPFTDFTAFKTYAWIEGAPSATPAAIGAATRQPRPIA